MLRLIFLSSFWVEVFAGLDPLDSAQHAAGGGSWVAVAATSFPSELRHADALQLHQTAWAKEYK